MRSLIFKFFEVFEHCFEHINGSLLEGLFCEELNGVVLDKLYKRFHMIDAIENDDLLRIQFFGACPVFRCVCEL